MNQNEFTRGENLPKGRKIDFYYGMLENNEDEGSYSDYYQPNMQEGSEADMNNLRWVMVTRDGYEYEGTLDEVKAMLAEYDKKDVDRVLSRQHNLQKRIIIRDDIDTLGLVTKRTFPYSAIGKIEVNCTGSFVDCRSVLTAAHCIYNRDYKQFYPWLDIQRNKKCDDDQGILHKWKLAIITAGYRDEPKRKAQNYDLGMIFYEKPSDVWLKYETCKFKRGQKIEINGYPVLHLIDEWKEFPPFCLWKSRCSITQKFPRRIGYRCDTYGGMSGGPIFARNNKNVIYAIHTTGNGICNNGRKLVICNSGLCITDYFHMSITSLIKTFG